MADPMKVLEQNYLGDSFKNRGLEELLSNRGIGVPEAKAKKKTQNEFPSNPSQSRDKLRTAKAREFGRTKEEVGF
jgi:hypothetical protein